MGRIFPVVLGFISEDVIKVSRNKPYIRKDNRKKINYKGKRWVATITHRNKYITLPEASIRLTAAGIPNHVLTLENNKGKQINVLVVPEGQRRSAVKKIYGDKKKKDRVRTEKKKEEIRKKKEEKKRRKKRKKQMKWKAKKWSMMDWELKLAALWYAIKGRETKVKPARRTLQNPTAAGYELWVRHRKPWFEFSQSGILGEVIVGIEQFAYSGNEEDLENLGELLHQVSQIPNVHPVIGNLSGEVSDSIYNGECDCG